ncbi:MAG: hypothetical protein M1819_006602 [Sarea resinae]|nr:MAG: hypothetical protein M1819_006602 [Sarea resinae]
MSRIPSDQQQPLDSATWARLVPPPTDIVSIQDLTLLPIGIDAWGRPGKPQPVTASVRISLAQPFESAASEDVVDESTVHYGVLAKRIAGAVAAKNGDVGGMLGLLEVLLEACCQCVSRPLCVQAVEVEATWLKASLLGDGVHGWLKRGFGNTGNICLGLGVKGVRVPCLIGVNANERTMKQLAIASVAIDGVAGMSAMDGGGEVEQILVKTIEESSFETLESLVTVVVARIIEFFVIRTTPGATVRLKVEKPTAIPSAQAPLIEISRVAASENSLVRLMLGDWGNKVPDRVPFPLQGRLDEWMEERLGRLSTTGKIP